MFLHGADPNAAVSSGRARSIPPPQRCKPSIVPGANPIAELAASGDRVTSRRERTRPGSRECRRRRTAVVKPTHGRREIELEVWGWRRVPARPFFGFRRTAFRLIRSAPTASGSWCSPTPASETSKRHTPTTFPRQGSPDRRRCAAPDHHGYTRSLDSGCGVAKFVGAVLRLPPPRSLGEIREIHARVRTRPPRRARTTGRLAVAITARRRCRKGTSP
jgi:hypothetical protein